MSLADSLKSSVLLASAGTGKTFQLSNRYLALVLHGAPVEGILASTFTRKAAGEILDSILGRLALACADSTERKALAGHLGLQSEWSHADAVGLLRALLRRLPHLQVGTLDSWFQRQVSAAALDLGLPFGWRLADQIDLEDLHKRAVEKTLDDLPRDQSARLLAAMQAGKPGRSVLSKAQELLKDAAKPWQACGANPAAWNSLSHIMAPDEAEIIDAIDALRAYVLPLTKAKKPNANWKKAMTLAIEAAQNNDWVAVMACGPLKALLEGNHLYTKVEIDASALRPVFQVAAMSILHREHKATTALRDLAEHYCKNYEVLQEESALLGFDDFPKCLASCSPEDRTRFTQRLGAATKHLLLDEFQDTSAGQWSALEQPATEALQTERLNGSGSLFVVGDPKQSIYGFREGEPRLLQGLSSWFDIGVKQMATNYRSAQTILDAVNHTFAGICDSFKSHESKVLNMTLENWKDYPVHTANNNGHGIVRVIEVQSRRANTAADNEMVVLERAAQLHEENPEQSIGILVGRNKTVSSILARLSALGIPASAAGGNALIDAHAVDVAMSMFQLADYPADTAAWFHVCTSPLAKFWNVHFVHMKERRAAAQSLSRRIRTRLVQDGYGVLLKDISSFLHREAAFDPWNLQRFEQLVVLGRSWDQRSDLRSARFPDMVKKHRVSSQSTGLVQVMTVHQSKGLDFDTVLLLVTAGPRKRDLLVTNRPDPRSHVTTVCRTPNATALALAKHQQCDEFVQTYEAQEARDLNELLCVLYVGMTRAKFQMEIILPQPAKNPSFQKDWLTTSDVLRSKLLTKPSPSSVPEESSLSWKILWQTEEMPTPNNKSAVALLMESEPASISTSTTPTPLFAPSKAQRSLPRWTPSAAAQEGGKIEAASLFADADGVARQRGTAIHRLFEEIEWLDDFSPEEDKLRPLLMKLEPAPSPAEALDWYNDFSNSLVLPKLVEALSKPKNLSPDVELEALRERPFAVKTIDAHGATVILQGIYDRVVLHRLNGKVIAASVMDFKTGAAPLEGAMPESYRLQLGAYRRALCVQYQLDPNDVMCQLLFVDSGTLSADR